MAKRKKAKKRVRRNPRRPIVRRAASRARATFAGLNFKSALKDIPMNQIGMFATKFLAKKFGGGAALETDPESWDWTSYLKGAAGATVAAFLMQMLRPGSGQKVLTGGLNLVVYKMIQNELVAGSAWASGQFGADDAYIPDEYMDGYGYGADEGYLPGDVEEDASGQSYLLGDDNQWHALPEEPMVDGYGGYGDVLEPVGRLGMAGEPLQPVGPLGENLDAAYRKALLNA